MHEPIHDATRILYEYVRTLSYVACNVKTGITAAARNELAEMAPIGQTPPIFMFVGRAHESLRGQGLSAEPEKIEPFFFLLPATEPKFDSKAKLPR